MSSAIFRKKVMMQLSSPDQLDSMIAIERPRHWLIAIVLLIAGIAVGSWSIYGEITQRVNSTGILITKGSAISNIVTTSEGQIEQILVNVGDNITKGQQIAIIRQANLDDRISTVTADLNDNTKVLNEFEAEAKEADNSAEETAREQTVRLNEQLKLIESRINRSRETLKEREELFNDNIITRTQLEQSRAGYERAISDEKTILDRLDALKTEASNRQQRNLQQLAQLRLQVSNLQNQLKELQTRLEKGLIVEATADGVVIDIKNQTGAVVGIGQPIVGVELSSDSAQLGNITFLNFISPGEGKKILVGQDALVTLSSADPSDYGKVKGKVTAVSTFPASLATVVSRLANENLARDLFNRGAPYEVSIELTIDPALAVNSSINNYFEWTTAKGNLIHVTSGTYATGEIVYEVRSPITLFIPALREWLKV